jgi:hypothetical protein
MIKRVLFFFLTFLSWQTVTVAQTYCTTNLYSVGCQDGDRIEDVTIGSFSQSATGCSQGAFANYTTDTIDLVQGTIVDISLSNFSYFQYYGLWIDLNDDGDFDDAGEFIWKSTMPTIGGSGMSSSLLLQDTVNIGTHRLRLRANWNNPLKANESCATLVYGEAHDYTVNILPAPPCPVPHTLNVAVANASALINWVSSGSSFTIEYGPFGYTQGTGTTITSNTNSVNITGLQGNKNYDVYVRNNCTSSGNGLSSWSRPISFATTGTTQAMPHVQNFSSWLPTGYNLWSTSYNQMQHNHGSALYWQQHTNGHAFAPIPSYPDQETAFLTTPPITISTQAQLKFKWAHRFTGLLKSSLAVRAQVVGTTQWDTIAYLDNANNFNNPHVANNTLWAPPPALSNFTNQLVYLDTAYIGDNVIFEFVVRSGQTSILYIDDLVIEALPACLAPTQIEVNNVLSNEATINWLSGSTKFIVEYGPKDFVQGAGTFDTVTANSITLTNLASYSQYDVYVRTDCSANGNGLTSWMGPIQFTTQCSAFSQGYFQNFDALNSGDSVPCWTDTAWGRGSTHYVEVRQPLPSYLANPVSSPSLLFWLDHSSDYSYVISPEFVGLDGDSSQIRFYMMKNSNIPLLDVWIGTTSHRGDTSLFHWVDTISLGANIWNQYTVPLVNIPTGHKYVIIGRNKQPYGAKVYVDNFHFEGIDSCASPSSLSATPLSASSATVQWQGSGSSFTLEYGSVGFIPGTGSGNVISNTSNQDTLTGLLGDTCYHVYVRQNCGNGTSAWYGPVSFCTPCPAQPLPIVEDFSTWPPFCFRFDRSENSTWNWTQDTNQHALAPFRFNATGTAIMKTPSMIINLGAELSFKWSHTYSAFSPGDQLVVRAHITGSGQLDTLVNLVGSTFHNPNQTVFIMPPSSLSDFIEEVIILDPAIYANTEVVIEFLATTNAGPHLYVDDISIVDYAICSKPTNFTASYVGCDSLQLSWHSDTNAVVSHLVYGPSGFDPNTGGTFISQATSPLSISGLFAASSYDFYLIDSCSFGTSEADSLMVNTASGPLPLASFNANQNTAPHPDTVQFSFDASPSTNTNAYWWDFGDGSPSANSSLVTHNYSQNGNYTVTLVVSNACGTDTTMQQVVVQGIAIKENELVQALTIFPNPTSEAFAVEFYLERESEVSLEVLDPVGRVVASKDLGKVYGEQQVKFVLDNQASGIYLIRIRTGLGIITKRVTVNK